MFLVFCLCGLTCFGQNKISFKNPPSLPQIFEEGIINTGARERDFAISPDGSEVYFTLQSPQGVFQTIVFMRKDAKGKWTRPEIASFAGQYTDLAPAFSPAVKKFFSRRPTRERSEVKILISGL